MTAPTGANAAQQRNRDAVETLEAQASTSVNAAITAMLAEVLDAVGDLDDDTVAPTVENVAAAARRAWNRVVGRVIAWVRDTFGRLVTRAVANLPDDTAPDLPPRTVEQRVATLADQIRAGLDHVPDVVASRVVTALRDGYDRGESPAALRRRVADVLGRDEWDAEVVRIARTTTTSLYNAAHTAAADALEVELGRPLRRLWISTRDTRTRPTHVEANGQVIDPGETFKVGDARLRFPGDPLGPREEIINCRCVVVPVVNDVVIDLAHRAIGREAAVLHDISRDTDTEDLPMAAAALEAATSMPPELVAYWTVGEGGARIRWGQPRDFSRCQRALRKYLRPDQVDGACANLHHIALGVWPGQEGQAAAAAEGEDDMPCPCENATEDEVRAAALAATVTGDPDLPLADRDHDWDGDAAADRVRAWATPEGAEMVDAEKYARAFFYRDPAGEPETESAYKLGFADVIDGELTAIPEGIYAVAAVLQGGRGGVDIPADDADGIRTRVGGYYRRMSEAWDDPDVVAPWDTETEPDSDAAPDPGTDMGATAARPIRAASMEDARMGGIIALVPSEADAARIAVDGGIPPEELHVTLAFLGPGEPWVGTPEGQRILDLAEAIAGDIGPITGHLWAVATVNPDTDEPVACYLVGEDTGRLAEVAAGIRMAVGDIIPPQHSPFVAHISTNYDGGDTTAMTATGSDVTLDRIRVSFAQDVTDFPLTGDDTLDVDEEPEELAVDESVDPAAMTDNETAAATVAAAGPAPARLVNLAAASESAAVVAEAAANAPDAIPGAWLVPVAVDGPTPPTVTAQGRVWGHIGQADVCHVGIKDECVTIPPTRTGYGAFHRDHVLTAEGDTVAVGYLYTGCDHSDLDLSIDEARDYLDASCTRTAAGRVYDTEFGPMFVGGVVRGATAANVAALHRLSGEWFAAPLELHAAVGVDAAGFPVEGTGDAVRTSDVDPEPAGQIAATADPFTTPEVVAGLVAAHRKRAAMRAAEPAVVAARRNRAARVVAAYNKRGA